MTHDDAQRAGPAEPWRRGGDPDRSDVPASAAGPAAGGRADHRPEDQPLNRPDQRSGPRPDTRPDSWRERQGPAPDRPSGRIPDPGRDREGGAKAGPDARDGERAEAIRRFGHADAEPDADSDDRDDDVEDEDWEEETEPNPKVSQLLEDLGRFGLFPEVGRLVHAGRIQGAVNLGDGPFAGRDLSIGRIVNYQVATTRRPIAGVLDRVEITRWKATYVEARPAFSALLTGLDKCRAQVLVGPGGTGRFTTAALALAERAERVVALETEDLSLLDEAFIQQAHGYLVDLTGSEQGDQLARPLLALLGQRLAERRSFLVALVDQDAELEAHTIERYLVAHEPPAAVDVFEAHFRQRAGHDTSTLRSDAGWAPLEEELKHVPGPRQAAELAAAVAAAVRDGGGLATVVGGLGSQLTNRVRAVLTPGRMPAKAATTSATSTVTSTAGKPRPGSGQGRGGEAGASPNGSELHARAFAVAGAILNGLPLGRVAAAADDLALRLHGVQHPERPLAREVFSSSIQRCQGFLTVTDMGGRSGVRLLPGTSVAWTRTVQLDDPALADATVMVVWEELDGAHAVLLDWLRSLAEGGDAMVRVRAALAVGKLATYDFGHIVRTVVGPWASADRVPINRLAALALDAAASDERLVSVVRRRLREWVREGGTARRRTAALAYGTQLGTRFPRQALRDLRRLAAMARPGDDDLVVQALVALVLATGSGSTLGTVAAWAGDGTPEGRRLAARCLVGIAGRPADTAAGTHPALPTAAGGSRRERDALARLWAAALSEPETAGTAWGALRQMTMRAETDPRVGAALTALVEDLAAAPWLCQRLGFYLRRWQLTPPSQVLGALLAVVRRARPPHRPA